MEHTIYDLRYHFIWRLDRDQKDLTEAMKHRLNMLLTQSCDTLRLKVLAGEITGRYVHTVVSCPASLAPSTIAQRLKGRSSKILQDEFSELKKHCRDQTLWERGYFCKTVGEVTDEMIRGFMER